jgi:prepilin signal peptidase PulO-like enzyme (type II secretory pathway)
VFALIVLVFFVFYLWIFTKVVEESSMIKEIPVGKLTEGDWILKDVVVRGKKICGPKDLGISLEQISELKKLKVKRVLVKEGLPFVPSFLVAFVITLLFENWFLYFV